MKQSFLIDSLILQFSILVTTFKCYKVYWLNDQERVYHKTKLLTMVFSQYIVNELDKFHPHETSFILIKLISSLSS
jgi:hypothetical protein